MENEENLPSLETLKIWKSTCPYPFHLWHSQHPESLEESQTLEPGPEEYEVTDHSPEVSSLAEVSQHQI